MQPWAADHSTFIHHTSWVPTELLTLFSSSPASSRGGGSDFYWKPALCQGLCSHRLFPHIASAFHSPLGRCYHLCFQAGELRMTNLKPMAQVNLQDVTMLGFNLRFVWVLSTASSHPVEGHIKPPGAGSQATLFSMAKDWNQNVFVAAQCNCSHNKFILFLGGNSDKESACKCRRCDPWVWKILWRRKWQPTSVCLHGKYHGQRSLVC